jgi:cell division protein ZapA
VNQEQNSSVLVSVTILDKELKFACKPEEQAVLRASAQYLNEKMRDIRYTGRIVGADRISVMAAINISRELLEQREAYKLLEQNLNERILSLQNKIESILNKD